MKLIILTICLLTLTVLSCGQPGTVDGESQLLDLNKNGKSKADAFLYDTRIWQDNKPTSIRLELYRTDSMLSFNGRAYLGKGALKGIFKSDSLSIYFPKTNELISDHLDKILTDSLCSSILSEFSLFEIFYDLPDTNKIDNKFLVSLLKDENKEIEYSIINSACDWEILAEYKLKDSEWLLNKIEFDNRKDVKIKANLREFRRDRSIKNRNLFPSFPADAIQIKR